MWGFVQSHASVFAKAVYLLGIANLLGLAAVFFSCRCLPGMAWLRPLWGTRWFQRFYRTHCWWWYFFFLSVLFHSVIALLIYGNPF